MGSRVLLLCALVLAGLAAPAALATDHPLAWPVCCESSPRAETDVAVGDTVTFTTADFSQHPLVWDYGDHATTSSGSSAQFAFPTAGTYPFHCQIHSYMIGAIKVGADQHPTPAFTVSTASPTTADAVTFTYTGSGDPDGTIADYEWDYDGDGTADQVTTTAQATHTYATAGTYHPTVRVRDNGHELSDAAPAQTVTASAPAPSSGSDPAPGGGTPQNPSPSADQGPAADTTAPAAARVRVAAGALRLTLSEAATLRGTLRRGPRVVARLHRELAAGAVAVRLPRHLRRGRYTIRFAVTDAAGNRSATRVVRFRVR